MSKIICQNTSVSYPIYNVDTRSLKRSIANVATGGLLLNENSGLLKIKALSDISFHLREGDRLGLIGHNGAGKSTLLRLLAGVYEPETGYTHIEGKISSLLNVHVGMQPLLTGYENIYIRCLLLGLSKKEHQLIRADVEEFTELGKFLAMPIKTYSTGMLIRLAFGLSTAVTPEILLVDEVIGAGDTSFMEKAKNRMARYIKKSNIMVLSSHDNKIIEQFCNRAMWLEHGQIKLLGPVDEVINAYKTNLLEAV